MIFYLCFSTVPAVIHYNNYYNEYLFTQNIKGMVDKLKSSTNAKEMEVNCQSLSRYLSHEVKIGRNRILEQITFLKGEKEMALNQVKYDNNY